MNDRGGSLVPRSLASESCALCFVTLSRSWFYKHLLGHVEKPHSLVAMGIVQCLVFQKSFSLFQVAVPVTDFASNKNSPSLCYLEFIFQ